MTNVSQAKVHFCKLLELAHAEQEIILPKARKGAEESTQGW